MTPRRRILPVFVPHLGCGHACVFCDQRRISGAQRPARPADVARAVEEAAARGLTGPALEIAFYGGSFTAIPVRQQQALLEATAQAIRDGKAGSIRLSTRPDCVDPETLERLCRSGVQTVELGAQSMDPVVLRLSGRGHTPADTARAAALVKAAGLDLVLQMMTGLPGDTAASSLETARQLAALKPGGVRIYPTVVIRNTPLFDLWRAGAYRAWTVEEAAALCADLLDLFEAADIPVIRLGLNPTAALSAGDAAAGPYHPAFGEIVYGLRYLRRAQALVEAQGGNRPGHTAVFYVGHGKTSRMAGYRGMNLAALRGRFGLGRIRIREVQLPPGEIRLEWV